MTPAARLARLLPDARPDGALLAAFLADRDEPAFAELVRRHGPLVLAACRRLLPDPADAADAFQASFLVLVRQARRLTGSAELGPWLYRVAAWTARNARRKNARRLARTAPLADTAAAPPSSPGAALDLDAALLALPEKYRAPLVLCHLQGWSRRDAAARLGCPEGTLSSLLARGLTKLKARLPGYEPAVALAVVPAALSAATVSAAAKPVPSVVAELAAAVLRVLWVPKATAAAAGVAAVFALGAGVGLSVREVPAVAQAPTAPAPRAKAPPFALRELEEAARTAVERVAAAKAGLRAAEDGLRLTREKLKLTENAVAKGMGTAADVAQDRQTAETFRQAAVRFRRELAEAHDARDRYAFAARRDGADVTGVLAVEVVFPDAARPTVAETARGLVESATHSDDGAGGADGVWDAARRLPHVHVRFPAPQRTVRVAEARDVALAEALVPLPLTRAPGGFVLVRDGGRLVYFSKYPAAVAARFQEALGAAVPAAP